MNIKANKAHRRFFTLIELMVCFTLLAIAGSFCVYKISAMLSSAKVHKEIKTLENHLDLCQKISALQQTDMLLKLFYEDKGLVCYIGEDLGEAFYQSPKLIKRNLSNLSFMFGKEKKELEVTFSSTGSVSPSGSLTLFSKQKKTSKELILKDRYITKEKIPPKHPFDTQAFNPPTLIHDE